MAGPDDAVALQTLLAHIQTAVWREGVPIARLEEMLAQLPAKFRGRFAATRETIELVVSHFPTKLYIGSDDKVYTRSEAHQVSTGTLEKHKFNAKDEAGAITHFRDVKGYISNVMSGYGFAEMKHPVEALVFVHRTVVKHGRPNDPNRLGLQEGDTVIMDVKKTGLGTSVQYQATNVRIHEDASRPVHNLLSVAAPRVGNEEHISNQIGTIHLLKLDSGLISFGPEGAECAFFMRSCISKTLLKPTEKLCEVFSVGDKVCFDAQLNHDTSKQEKWQATMVTTIQRCGSHSTVFGDVYEAPTRTAVAVRRCVPETLRKPSETLSEGFSAGGKVGFDAQPNLVPARQEMWQPTMVTTVQCTGSSKVFGNAYKAPITTAAARSCIPETWLKPTEALPKVSSVGDKVCFDAKRNLVQSRQDKWQPTMVTTVQRSQSTKVFDNVYKLPTMTAAAVEENKKKKPSCADIRKKHARGGCHLDQCVSVEFSARKKMSKYRGTFHAESETLGHVKCHCDGTIVLTLIDTVYGQGKKIQSFRKLLEGPAVENKVDVFVDAVEAERDFWLATLVWTGERPVKPHVYRSEDMFSSLLASVRDEKGNSGFAAVKYNLVACQKCLSTPGEDTLLYPTKSIDLPAVQQTTIQLQEPNVCLPTAFSTSRKGGIVHSDVSSGWKPCAAVPLDHSRSSGLVDVAATQKTTCPAPVGIAMPRTAGTSEATAFQGSVGADFADTLSGQLAACSDMPGTRQPAAALLSRDDLTEEYGDLDDGDCNLNEETLQWITACIEETVLNVIKRELQTVRLEFLGRMGIAGEAAGVSSGHNGPSVESSKTLVDSEQLQLQAAEAPETTAAAGHKNYWDLHEETVEKLRKRITEDIQPVIHQELEAVRLKFLGRWGISTGAVD
ncbi:uncharacterized protein LOC142557456 [Dermacentor variabilis]|uniref:uncharacterized protein LOC142557456 n=1 Tax=Dermacentor variabilis TaxID=34621 RepID=UPI003F5BB9C1